MPQFKQIYQSMYNTVDGMRQLSLYYTFLSTQAHTTEFSRKQFDLKSGYNKSIIMIDSSLPHVIVVCMILVNIIGDAGGALASLESLLSEHYPYHPYRP